MTTVDTSKPPTGKSIVRKREGINTWGMYVEILHTYKTTGKLALVRRLLVADNTVSESVKKVSAKQAIWKCNTFASHDEAMAKFQEMVNKAFEPTAGPLQAELRGDPVIVQLTETDIDLIRQGKAPFCRYSAAQHIDGRFGKLQEAAYRSTAGPTTPAGATI